MTLFEEYLRLGDISFERSITPAEALNQPIGVTFSEGSEASYGAILYLRWETRNEVVVRLVESKAKLTPRQDMVQDRKSRYRIQRKQAKHRCRPMQC